jgi:AraC family transcriptional regulator
MYLCRVGLAGQLRTETRGRLVYGVSRTNHFFGQTLRIREVGGLMLAETVYGPNHRLPRHTHDHSSFCFVLQGTFTGIYGTQTRACWPGTLVFHPSDEPHSECFEGSGARLFSLGITDNLVQRASELIRLRLDAAEFYRGIPPLLAAKLYREFHRPDAASALAIEGLALELVAEACRHSAALPNGKAARWLQQARDLLHDRFAEPLTLNEIARTVGVHPIHLARSFRKRFGNTIGEYVRQLRLEWASQKLAETQVPLVEIALQAGFSSQSHFATAFKRHMSMTPAEYRATFRPR